MLNQNFVFLGSFIVILGSLHYLINILHGRVKPNKISFFMWSLAPLIAFFAEVNQGVGVVAVITLTPAITSLILLLASFTNKKAEWKMRSFDLWCGVLSLIGLILWQITKIGNTAILFSIFADVAAALPTVMKTYHYPKTEVAWPWLATALGSAITLLTIHNWSFANYGFPAYNMLINLLILFLAICKLPYFNRRFSSEYVR